MQDQSLDLIVGTILKREAKTATTIYIVMLMTCSKRTCRITHSDQICCLRLPVLQDLTVALHDHLHLSRKLKMYKYAGALRSAQGIIFVSH